MPEPFNLDAAAERGARIRMPDGYHALRGPTAGGARKDQARAVLTAALRLDDPGTVERVAKALRDELVDTERGELHPALEAAAQARWRRVAQAVLDALLGSTDADS